MADEPNLFAQQEANRRNSRWLIIWFILFFAWLGFGGDLIARLATENAPRGEYQHAFPFLGIGLTLLGVALAWVGWRTGPDRVLWSTGAQELLTPATPAQQQLVNVVEEMSIASGLPKPRIYIVPDADPNAFATGRDPETARIAVTEGLLATLSRDELQAVIGHELGHVKNLDVRLMTLLAGLVGAVAIINDGMGRMLRGGARTGVRIGGSGGGGGGGGGRKKDLGPLVVILLALWILSWILAPLITRVLALGVSRKREYLADAMSAQFTRNPMALASALEKIEHADAPTSSIKRGCAHLCIADPLGRRIGLKEGRLADLLATHPPMPLRISKLRAMAYQEMKRSGTFPHPDARDRQRA